MILQLYEKFQYWSSKGSIWIYSDTHFDDDDNKKIDSSWPSPQEQIKIINSKVRKGDTLIILGDIGNPEYIKQLNGYKVLIAGNHDAGLSNYKKIVLHRIFAEEEWSSEAELRRALRNDFPHAKIDIYKSYEFHAPFVRYNVTIDNNMFDEVYGGPLFIGEKILLSHEPIYSPNWYNIHGHRHADTKEEGIGENYYNVCSNVCGFEPINLGKLIKEGCLSRIDSIHRTTINRATKAKNGSL